MTIETPSRPIIRYHGGKWRIAPWIIEHFPAHRLYIEPFGGGASVLLQKPPCRTEIYNDLDAEIYGLFKVLRDPAGAARLAELLLATPFSRDEYGAAYEPTDCSIEKARRTIVKSFMGMGSRGIFQKSGFDARVNDDDFVSRHRAFSHVPEMLARVQARLRQVVLENTDGIDLCQRYAAHAQALIYVDPPYVFDSYSGGHIYRCRMTDNDHRRLATVLGEVKGAVIISGYHSTLYDEIYAGWQRVEKPALADGGRSRIEVLWMKNARINAPELVFGGAHGR